MKRQVAAANKAGKQAILTTKRTLKRAVSQGKKQQQNNELQYIERLLGEDFENLSQARRAMTSEVKTLRRKATKKEKPIVTFKQLSKVLPKRLTPKAIKKSALGVIKESVKQVTKAIVTQAKEIAHPFKQSQPHITVSPSAKIYTMRDLKDGDRRAIGEYLQDRLNANALDKVLLQPGESWAATVSYRYTATDGKVKTGYANTHHIYANAYALFKTLSGYVEHAKISANQKAQWLNQIKIVKFGGSGNEWKAKKEKETIKQDVRRKKVSAKLRKKGKKNA